VEVFDLSISIVMPLETEVLQHVDCIEFGDVAVDGDEDEFSLVRIRGRTSGGGIGDTRSRGTTLTGHWRTQRKKIATGALFCAQIGKN